MWTITIKWSNSKVLRACGQWMFNVKNPLPTLVNTSCQNLVKKFKCIVWRKRRNIRCKISFRDEENVVFFATLVLHFCKNMEYGCPKCVFRCELQTFVFTAGRGTIASAREWRKVTYWPQNGGGGGERPSNFWKVKKENLLFFLSV